MDQLNKVNTSISHISYDLNFDKKKLQKLQRKLKLNSNMDPRFKHLERLKEEYEIQKIIYAQVRKKIKKLKIVKNNKRNRREREEAGP